MGRGSFESKLIQKQNIYIRQLEEQLSVYREKDREQELLIEKMQQVIGLLEEENAMLKGGIQEE